MTLSLVAAAALATGFLIGLIPTVIDGSKSALQGRTGVSTSAMDWFSRLFYFAWLPAMPLAGYLLDWWPNRELLLFGGLIPLILGLAWLGLARSGSLLLLNGVVLGTAYSVVTAASVRLMPVAFFPIDEINWYRLNIASLNLGFVAVGAGALVGPWIVTGMERWFGPRQGILYLSIALLGPAVLTALADEGSFPPPASHTAPWDDVFTHPQLGMVAAVILIYFALENCLEYWPEAYLKQIGYEGRGLHGALIAFWLTFIVSRGAAAWLLYENSSADNSNFAFVFTLILLGASALVLGNLAGGFELGSGTFGFCLLGACYGPLLPGLLGIALDLYPTLPLPSFVLGGLLALSGFDTLVVRPTMSVFTQNRPARSVMRAPAILALLAAAVLLVLAFLRN